MAFGGSPLGAHISGGLMRMRMQIHNALWDNGVYLIGNSDPYRMVYVLCNRQ